MKLKMMLATAALLTMGISSAARADSLIFTLVNPTGYAPVTGGTVSYGATVTAPTTNTAAIFLNGDSYNISAPFTVNDNGFFNNFPLSLAPGASYTGSLFTLTVPSGTPFGNYLGTFSLLGGANAGAGSTLGTVNVTLATTPEPSSLVLLLTGMVGAFALYWSRSKQNARGLVG